MDYNPKCKISIHEFIVAVQSLKFCPTLYDPMNCGMPLLLCPLLSPRVCSNSCSLSWWCHPTISSSVVPFFSCLHPSQNQGLFQWVSSSDQVAKVLKLQLQHQSSDEYSGLTSFRIDWFDLAVQGTFQESSPAAQFGSINFFGTQPSLWSISHIHT